MPSPHAAGRARRGPTLRECVLMHAVARLALPNIRNIQARGPARIGTAPAYTWFMQCSWCQPGQPQSYQPLSCRRL